MPFVSPPGAFRRGKIGSIGPVSTLGENFNAMFRQQRDVDSAFGFQQRLIDKFNTNEELMKSLDGKSLGQRPLDIRSIPGMAYAVREALGEGRGTVPQPAATSYSEQLAQYNERARMLKETNPEVKTFDELLEDERRERLETIEEAEDVGERATGLGSVVGFLGSVAGSLDPTRGS